MIDQGRSHECDHDTGGDRLATPHRAASFQRSKDGREHGAFNRRSLAALILRDNRTMHPGRP